MRVTLALLAAATMCLPISAQAHEISDWGQDGMMGWDHSRMEGWGHPGMMPRGGHGMGWGHPGMMPGGGQGMGWGEMPGWGPPRQMGGGMGHLLPLMPILMAMADTNGDGALSLEEHQAVHSRMFHYFDVNKDGKLTPEEVQSAFRGGTSTTGTPPGPASQPSTTNQ
jgi:hypothetical protein